jgi:hypothetical protein
VGRGQASARGGGGGAEGRAAVGGSEGLPVVSVVAARGGGEEGRTRAALLEHAVQSLKPGVFEELMELMGVV